MGFAEIQDTHSKVAASAKTEADEKDNLSTSQASTLVATIEFQQDERPSPHSGIARSPDTGVMKTMNSLSVQQGRPPDSLSPHRQPQSMHSERSTVWFDDASDVMVNSEKDVRAGVSPWSCFSSPSSLPGTSQHAIPIASQD